MTLDYFQTADKEYKNKTDKLIQKGKEYKTKFQDVSNANYSQDLIEVLKAGELFFKDITNNNAGGDNNNSPYLNSQTSSYSFSEADNFSSNGNVTSGYSGFRQVKRIDSKPTELANNLINFFSSNGYKKGARLFKLIKRTDEEDKETTAEIQEVEKIIHKVIHESNFGSEFIRSGRDLMLGTAALMVVEDLNQAERLPFYVKHVPLANLALEHCNTTEIGMVFRQIYILPDKFISFLNEIGMEEEDFELLKKQFDYEKEGWKNIISDNGKKYISILQYFKEYEDESISVEKERIVQEKNTKVGWCLGERDFLLKEEDFDYNPMNIFSWQKVPNSPFGQGAAINAVNATREYLKAMERKNHLQQQPLYLVVKGGQADDDIFGDPNQDSHNGSIDVRVVEGNAQQSGYIDSPIALINSLSDSIAQHLDQMRACFYASSIDPHAKDMGTPRSALEISIIDQKSQKVLDPQFTLLSNELLLPFIGKVFHILSRGDYSEKLKEFEVLAVRNGMVVKNKSTKEIYDIVIDNPFTRNQRAEKAESLNMLMQTLSSIAGNSEALSVLDVLDVDKTLTSLFINLDIPLTLKNSEGIQRLKDGAELASESRNNNFKLSNSQLQNEQEQEEQ